MAVRKEFPQPGSGDGKGKDNGALSDRALDELWKHAHTEIVHYKGGRMRLPNGKIYQWRPGNILTLDLQDKKVQLMSDCERACSNAMVDIGFQEVQQTKREGPYGVIECGFGMGLTARRVMRHLNYFGGWYDVVEKNDEIAASARTFADQQNRGRNLIAGGTESERLPIRVFTGDAAKALERRAQKIAEGKEQPANLLVLDTNPKKASERGIHDLKYLGAAKRCITPDGAIIIFLFYPGTTGGITKIQEELIAQDFQEWRHIEVPNPERQMPIDPGPEYEYLWTPEGYPVTHLSVGVLRHPKL